MTAIPAVDWIFTVHAARALVANFYPDIFAPVIGGTVSVSRA